MPEITTQVINVPEEITYRIVDWKDGQTPLDDDNLNIMDEGIYKATEAVNGANENIRVIKADIEIIGSDIDTINTNIDNISNDITSINGRVGYIDNDIRNIRNDIRNINDNVGTNIGRIDNAISEIEDNIRHIVDGPSIEDGTLSKTLVDAKNYTNQKISESNQEIYAKIETETQKINSTLTTHIIETDNPHGITQDTIGLSNVANKSPDELQNLFTADKIRSGEQRFVTGDMVYSAFGSHKLQWQDIT